MTLLISEIKRVIKEFISSTGKEIEDKYNVTLSEDSISGKVVSESAGVHSIGRWDITREQDFWEASYIEPISINEEIEVVLVIKEADGKYFLSDWSVCQYF